MERVGPSTWQREISVPLGAEGYAYVRNGMGFEGSDVIFPNETEDDYYRHRPLPKGAEVNDVVAQWRWWAKDPATYTYPEGTKAFKPRVNNEEFQDGIAIIDYWWDVFYDNGVTEDTIAEIKQDNAEWVQLSPTWRVKEDGNSVELWKDCGYCYPDKATRFETKAATGAGLNVIWRFQIWQAEEMDTKNRSESWWHAVSAANTKFILDSAALAEELGVEATPVGAEYNSLTRALLSDEAPDFVREEWIQAIRDARKVYSGKLYYDLNNNGPVDQVNSIYWQYERVKDVIAETDFVGVSWWQAISDNCDPTIEGMEENTGRIMDADFKRIYEETGKPLVLISLAIPSIECGSMGNTLYEYDAREMDIWNYDEGTPNDMDEQARAYEAVMRGIADRPWIIGVYSFGYWRMDMQGKDWNIRGKPAQLVLRKWYASI